MFGLAAETSYCNELPYQPITTYRRSPTLRLEALPAYWKVWMLGANNRPLDCPQGTLTCVLVSSAQVLQYFAVIKVQGDIPEAGSAEPRQVPRSSACSLGV